ncbi:hypothetical protein, partial [Pseudonocardia sp.]|uniref:hypothetical protein n=1 Tax=Pseudonocardia sp. TaxID=60912 RepID=UPI002D7E8ECA
MTRHMLWVICRDADEYAALDDLVKRDLVVANMLPLGCGVGDFVDRVFRPVRQRRMLLQPFLEVVDRRQMLTDARLDLLVSAARQRARKGIPLAALLWACSVPKLLPRRVTWAFGAAQAIRRYSLITPPRTRCRRIGASSGITVA